MNWNAAGVVVNAVTGAVVTVSLIVFWRQFRELQRATHAQSFFTALARMQDENVRRARKHAFTLQSRDLSKWTAEDVDAVEVVCQTYDSVGIMVRNDLLPKSMIIDFWGASLVRLWPIVEPLIKSYRQKRGIPNHWTSFEWLVRESEKLDLVKTPTCEEGASAASQNH